MQFCEELGDYWRLPTVTDVVRRISDAGDNPATAPEFRHRADTSVR